jgi:hypothetical protein
VLVRVDRVASRVEISWHEMSRLCLGKAAEEGKWAVSPNSGHEIVSLKFEEEFGLLVDLSADPRRN